MDITFDKTLREGTKSAERRSILDEVKDTSQKRPNKWLLALRSLTILDVFTGRILEQWLVNWNDRCYQYYANNDQVTCQEAPALYSTHEEADIRGHLKTLGNQMGYPIGVLIWVAVKINDQTIFRSILLSRRCQLGLPN